MTGESCPPAGGFDIQWWLFACGIKMTRMLHKLSTRRTASLTKVSAATISRAEAGRPISAQSYLALCTFIGTHPHHYTPGFTGNSLCNSLAEKPIADAADRRT